MGYELEDEELFFGDAQTTTCIEKFQLSVKRKSGLHWLKIGFTFQLV